MRQDVKAPGKQGKNAKSARRADALRANLQKRKEQARARQTKEKN